MSKQFEYVDGKHGAPMGRGSYGEVGKQPKMSDGTDDIGPAIGAPGNLIRLFKVHLCDGYDDGGAYWGWPDDLWCARCDGYRDFTRAATRSYAAAKLGIDNKNLYIKE